MGSHPSSSPMSSRGHARGVAERVREAMQRVACADFVGETTSEPLETMLRALRLTKGHRVLEIGSSDGYETAVVALLAREVVSLVSTSDEAAARARRLLALGLRNVKFIVGKNASAALGSGPYQAVIVAAAAVAIPEGLLDALDADGRLVIPLGDATGQVIELVSRRGPDVHSEALCPCHLPMLHGAGGRPSFFPWNG